MYRWQHRMDVLSRLLRGAAAVSKRKTVWICQACGRIGKTRLAVGDESCYLHAILVYEDSINLTDRTAEAVPKEENTKP